MIAEQNEVELLSIRSRSMADIDSEIRNVIAADSKTMPAPFETLARMSSHSESECPEADEHYESSVRRLMIEKTANGACGFHLTRTKWDPYPWVSAIDSFTPAERAGLRAGDCVLEVNGNDVLGMRITEIAELVKSSQHQVTLLLWSSQCKSDCHEESLCAAPMPRTLQRLSAIVQCILTVIECPVCLDTITPPAMQCQNGHLLCVNCRIRAQNCPICRDRYYPRPALIVEQLQTAITSAFNLCHSEDKVRSKIFGRHQRQQQMVRSTLECIKRRQVHKSCNDIMATGLDNEKLQRTSSNIAINATTPYGQATTRLNAKRAKSSKACNKWLTKLLNFKTHSLNAETHSAHRKSLQHSNGLPPNGRAQQHQLAETNQVNGQRAATNLDQLRTSMASNKLPSDPSNPSCCQATALSDTTNVSSALCASAMNGSARTMSCTNVHCVLESKGNPLTSLSLHSKAVSDLNINNSPLVLKRRPMNNSGGDSSLCTIPRATSAYKLYHQEPTDQQQLNDLPSQVPGGDENAEESNTSTASTISLKSLASCSSATS